MADLTSIKYGLALACVALTGIFLLFVVWYTLMEISGNKALKSGGKLLWSLAVLILPGIGSFCYFNVGKRKAEMELQH